MKEKELCAEKLYVLVILRVSPLIVNVLRDCHVLVNAIVEVVPVVNGSSFLVHSDLVDCDGGEDDADWDQLEKIHNRLLPGGEFSPDCLSDYKGNRNNGQQSEWVTVTKMN